jgi:lactoylglutathione lyase
VLNITHVSRIDIPVHDRDESIAFYRERLGCSLVSDDAFGDGNRWTEVRLPGAGPTFALVRPTGDLQPGRMTGVVLTSDDPRADHAALSAAGVDVDDELIGGSDDIPVLFFFRDCCGNTFMVVERS